MMEKLLHERLREMADGIDCDEPRRELGYEVDDEHGKRECAWCSKGALEAIADEIKRYYIPRPRFEDGETVVKGSETDFGTVWSVGARDDGYWRLFDEDGVELCCGEKGEFVKRPTTKACDADGVGTKVGDAVFWLDSDSVERLTVKSLTGSHTFAVSDDGHNVNAPHHSFTHERPVFDADGVRICKGDTDYWTNEGRHVEVLQVGTYQGGKSCLVRSDQGTKFVIEGKELTHREPDSLEKLRDEISEAVESWGVDEFDWLLARKWSDRLTALIEMSAK